MSALRDEQAAPAPEIIVRLANAAYASAKRRITSAATLKTDFGEFVSTPKYEINAQRDRAEVASVAIADTMAKLPASRVWLTRLTATLNEAPCRD